MVYASIYLYFSQFLSSVFHSFLSTDLLPLWLILFLGAIFLFVEIANGIVLFIVVQLQLSPSSLHYSTPPYPPPPPTFNPSPSLSLSKGLLYMYLDAPSPSFPHYPPPPSSLVTVS